MKPVGSQKQPAVGPVEGVRLHYNQGWTKLSFLSPDSKRKLYTPVLKFASVHFYSQLSRDEIPLV